jgi:hypothetical protein
MLLEKGSGDFRFQFPDNGHRDEPGDDEGAGTNLGEHHGKLSEVVVMGVLLSKLFHHF